MIDSKTVDFKKGNGLVPCIIQDHFTKSVLMLGYMNEEALSKTIEEKKVTFWSRKKNRLWRKGEESGNFLNLISIQIDCDDDTLLIKVQPIGPTCHKGTDSCWGESNPPNSLFLDQLENTIQSRISSPSDQSYTSFLFKKGINKIAQKVGEEAVELIIESKDDNAELFLNEASDLMYHYLVLLAAKGFQLSDVIDILKKRQK